MHAYVLVVCTIVCKNKNNDPLHTENYYLAISQIVAVVVVIALRCTFHVECSATQEKPHHSEHKNRNFCIASDNKNKNHIPVFCCRRQHCCIVVISSYIQFHFVLVHFFFLIIYPIVCLFCFAISLHIAYTSSHVLSKRIAARSYNIRYVCMYTTKCCFFYFSFQFLFT